MKTYFIITNDGKDPGLHITTQLETYLTHHGASCTHTTLSSLRKQEASFPDGCEMCIVLGGDGTMLEATHFLKDKSLPLLGVNLGNIGYLTETNADHLEDALQKVTSGAYSIEARMMLEGVVRGADGSVKGERWTALNDIVTARYGSIGMIRLDVEVNGQMLCAYHADGLILATPTGSTGYNMSVAGPIVEPVAQLILMTPVAPHALSSRSIILSPEDRITLGVHPTHAGEEMEAEVSFDAAHTVRIKEGDTIEVTRAKRVTNIVRLEQASFLDVLHRKMV